MLRYYIPVILSNLKSDFFNFKSDFYLEPKILVTSFQDYLLNRFGEITNGLLQKAQLIIKFYDVFVSLPPINETDIKTGMKGRIWNQKKKRSREE